MCIVFNTPHGLWHASNYFYINSSTPFTFSQFRCFIFKCPSFVFFLVLFQFKTIRLTLTLRLSFWMQRAPKAMENIHFPCDTCTLVIFREFQMSQIFFLHTVHGKAIDILFSSFIFNSLKPFAQKSNTIHQICFITSTKTLFTSKIL